MAVKQLTIVTARLQLYSALNTLNIEGLDDLSTNEKKDNRISSWLDPDNDDSERFYININRAERTGMPWFILICLSLGHMSTASLFYTKSPSERGGHKVMVILRLFMHVEKTHTSCII